MAGHYRVLIDAIESDLDFFLLGKSDFDLMLTGVWIVVYATISMGRIFSDIKKLYIPCGYSSKDL